MRLSLLLCSINLFSLYVCVGQGPYAPAAGQTGSSAIHKDSSVFVNWASSVVVEQGYIDITDPSQGLVTAGSEMDAEGPADGTVISLGDSGIAHIYINGYLYDGPGWDFAVFENSFSDNFLELAKVFVSSDNVNYYEFPCHSMTPDTVDIEAFGSTDPTMMNNLAGKYRAQYGTPFDLSELDGIPGLNINAISSVKLIDAVGSSDIQYATKDTAGNKIIDPFTTPFPSAGFDLDAVGFMHLQTATNINKTETYVSIYPNPVKHTMVLKSPSGGSVVVYNTLGDIVNQYFIERGENKLNLDHLPRGNYIININFKDQSIKRQFVKVD